MILHDEHHHEFHRSCRGQASTSTWLLAVDLGADAPREGDRGCDRPTRQTIPTTTQETSSPARNADSKAALSSADGGEGCPGADRLLGLREGRVRQTRHEPVGEVGGVHAGEDRPDDRDAEGPAELAGGVVDRGPDAGARRWQHQQDRLGRRGRDQAHARGPSSPSGARSRWRRRCRPARWRSTGTPSRSSSRPVVTTTLVPIRGASRAPDDGGHGDADRHRQDPGAGARAGRSRGRTGSTA